MRIPQLVTFAGLAMGIAQSAIAADAPANIFTVRTEAIPIETLTISDEQFLKGDAYGRPTIIAGTLRIAKGSGRLPLVVLVPGSGGLNPNLDVWGRQFEEMGISTFAMDSFAGRGIVSTVVDQSQLGRLNMIVDLYRSLARACGASPCRSVANSRYGIFSRRAGDALFQPPKISEAMEHKRN